MSGAPNTGMLKARRFTGSAVGRACWVAGLLSLVLWQTDCLCTTRVPKTTHEGTSASVAVAVSGVPWPEPGLAAAEVGPSIDPPTLEEIMDRGRNPYHHSPVTWEYLATQVRDGETVMDTRVGMITTRERVALDGVGLLLKLVVHIQGPGPVSTRLGESFPPEYRSHVALLSPQGLFVSEPNLPEDDLEGRGEELAASLTGSRPTWPLPGAPGCQYETTNVALPFGRTRGIVTRCPGFESYLGPADVTTVWVERVGFVYREVVPKTEEGTVLRDYLVESDLTELAPPMVDGAEVLELMP